MMSSLNKTDITIHTISHSLINIGSLVLSCPRGQPWRRSQRRRVRTTHLWQRDRTTMRDSSDLAAASSHGLPSSRPVGQVWSESEQLENNKDLVYFVYFVLIYNIHLFKHHYSVLPIHNEAILPPRGRGACRVLLASDLWFFMPQMLNFLLFFRLRLKKNNIF